MKHNNTYSIDMLSYNSKMKNWNSELKIIFSLLSMLVCVISSNIFSLLFVTAAMAAISIGIGGVSLKEYIKLMAIPISFIIFGTAAIAVGFSKEPISQYNLNLKWFYLYSSNDGIFKALKAALKALGAVSSLYMMALSTPLNEIITAMRKIHIPKLIIELMHMLYRFIFMLSQVHQNITVSAKSRLGYCDFKTSVNTFANSAANLLIISLKKANAYYNAIQSRCYTDEILFWEDYNSIKINQIIFVCLYFMCIVAIIIFVR